MTTIRTEPITGNESFRNVVNSAGQFQSINIGNSVIQNLNVDSISSQYIWSNPDPTNVEKLLSVTGSSSTSYPNLASGESQFLNVNPGQPNATTVAGGVLTLPPNATIVGAYAIDETLTGVIGMRIGTESITGNQATSKMNIFTTDQTKLNSGTQVIAQQSLATAGLGTSGVRPITSTLRIPSTGTTGVSITVIGGPITATSGLKVTIFYLPTPEPGTA